MQLQLLHILITTMAPMAPTWITALSNSLCHVQVVKVVFPVYYGSRYQMTKVPQQVFLKGIEVYHAVQNQAQEDDAAQAAPTNSIAAGLEVTAAAWHSMQDVGKVRSCAAEVALSTPNMPMFQRQAVA